jgi:hypothetical protein
MYGITQREFYDMNPKGAFGEIKAGSTICVRGHWEHAGGPIISQSLAHFLLPALLLAGVVATVAAYFYFSSKRSQMLPVL